MDGEGKVDGEGDAGGAGALRPGDGPALVAPADTGGGDVGRTEAGAVRAGVGAPLVVPGVVLDAGAGMPPPSPGPEACGRCDAPAVIATVIPAATPTAATTASAATAATAPGCRRTPRHHDGPDGPIPFGKPAGPNTPARCATVIRCARPAGELSAQAVSTRLRKPGGSGTSGGSAP